jgi:hypothetical protein
MIKDLTRKAECRGSGESSKTRPAAIVMPHAGYVFSGLTAAHAACCVKGHDFSKIIILAPDHRVGFKGGAVSSAAAFRTPIGDVPVHADASMLIKKHSFLRSVAASDKSEHAVEVILPFLQTWLSDFEIIPLVMGRTNIISDYASALEPIIDSNTLLIVSTDLSHYLPWKEANKKDQQTIHIIETLDAEQLAADRSRACGIKPLLVLLELAEKYNWKTNTLHYSNSGDTAGDKNRVVGYTTIAFYGETIMPDDHENKTIDDELGKILLKTARQTIADQLGLEVGPEKKSDTGSYPSELDSPRGTFVTLKINNQLRGCIGNLTPETPVLQGVKNNAINAAFHDPRFSPLSKEEFGKVQIEVSLLTQPEPLEYRDAADLLDKLRPHVDGVIIQKGPYSATFLPQVWEQLPEKQAFLQQLCMKAGLSANAWQRGDLKVLTYQVQYFEEPM